MYATGQRFARWDDRDHDLEKDKAHFK